MAVAIEAAGIGKRYRLGEFQAAYGTLRESLTHATKRLLGKESARSPEEIWALRDVSFEVAQGEVLGVIGRNGAGKSTLLKVLTRITAPTEGRAEIRGRVGSLLEVGTGFHPELTGRENIYLNGAILGMKRREIQAKLPEIVEFSGVAKFLDTPVKRYSSGMYVRLAFSVAAHLEPEILLVDEVLAVGDAEFQARCLGRMEDFGATGRTVLFVSHNMQAVAQLCDRALLLDGGSVVLDGPSEKVVAHYLQHTAGAGSSRPGPISTPRPVTSSSAFVAFGSSTRTVRRWTTSTFAGRSGSSSRSRCSATGRRSSRRSSSRPEATSPSTRWTSIRAGTRSRRPATTSRRRGSRATT